MGWLKLFAALYVRKLRSLGRRRLRPINWEKELERADAAKLQRLIAAVESYPLVLEPKLETFAQALAAAQKKAWQEAYELYRFFYRCDARECAMAREARRN